MGSELGVSYRHPRGSRHRQAIQQTSFAIWQEDICVKTRSSSLHSFR
ncbi:hypothetical protein G647_01615 [Cladophialophora carrionii CBS 160.54]|uniref:Uncharacterized protein n=1 Tax=Cladophialophora carrionii CBS 160.54 TaxID=1279043 RepID=V9DT55_9EURO|nr:uncharacterized protein G647_01615 [Cladophialophora carrionii CBS 160.54]ETI29162.1 hypothetical protein G647_01615 [Cladophialophora carrionii CBS 160.54]